MAATNLPPTFMCVSSRVRKEVHFETTVARLSSLKVELFMDKISSPLSCSLHRNIAASDTSLPASRLLVKRTWQPREQRYVAYAKSLCCAT